MVRDRSQFAVGGLLLAFLCFCGSALGADRFDGELTFGHDSNLGNGRHNGQLHEDAFALLAAHVGAPWPASESSAVQVQLGVQGQHYFRFEELSNVEAQLLGRYVLRPGAGFFVPTLSLFATAARLEYESRLRDSHEYRAKMFLLQPLTTRLALRVSLAAHWRRDSRGEIFDTGMQQVATELDWRMAARTVAYGGYQFRRGDFVSVGLPPPPVLAASSAFGPDDVFSGEVAYRQDGDAHIGTLGVNRALARRLSLDLQVQHVDAQSDFGIHYRRWIALGSLLWRY